MPITRFKPRVLYLNNLLLPASLYNIQVPAGLSSIDVRAPLYVSAAQMQRLSPSSTITVVAGLTTANFALRFSNFNQQWRQVSSRSSTPQWQFQGGTVYFEVTIGLYVAQGFRQDDQILSVIMEHELLHVYDEIDIVSRYMQTQAPRDRYINRYLTNRQLVDGRMFNHWFRGRGFEQWVRNGIWAHEHNRRKQSRDSGSEWTRFRQRIDTLMRRTRN